MNKMILLINKLAWNIRNPNLEANLNYQYVNGYDLIAKYIQKTKLIVKMIGMNEIKLTATNLLVLKMYWTIRINDKKLNII